MVTVGMGEMTLIIVGGLNLSMGSCVALGTVLIAIMTVRMSIPWGIAILINLLVMTLIGFATGWLINKTKIVPMIGTMAVSTVVSGAAYLSSGGLPISGIPDAIKWFYKGNIGVIPIPIITTTIIALIFAFVFNRTYFGRQIYAAGSNREAARLSGINTDKIFIGAYVICGLLCGMGGLMMIGRLGSGQAQTGTTLDMDCLSALVIGGVSFLGGEGKVSKAICGFILITELTNGLTLCGVNDYVQMIITGSVFLAAVVLDSIQHGNVIFARKKSA